MATRIELTQGYFATVDDADAEAVNSHSWCVQQYKDKSGHGRTKIYAKSAIGGTQVTMHRFILQAPKGSIVDHIDGDPLNNQRSNLRLATRSTNGANRPKDRVKGATSTFKGVYRPTGGKKWIARIHHNNKAINLGSFDTEVEAAKAYNTAALNLFGEFACLNQLP